MRLPESYKCYSPPVAVLRLPTKILQSLTIYIYHSVRCNCWKMIVQCHILAIGHKARFVGTARRQCHSQPVGHVPRCDWKKMVYHHSLPDGHRMQRDQIGQKKVVHYHSHHTVGI